MNQSEDEKLVKFLQQYQLVPPEPPVEEEQRLLTAITPHSSNKPWWFAPSLVIAGTLFAWGGYSFLKPHPPQLAYSSQEIETFLVNNWNPSGESTMEINVLE